MAQKPVNLRELFRRALTSQIDLGMGEVVVQDRQASRVNPAGLASDGNRRVVPAAEAITSRMTGLLFEEEGPPIVHYRSLNKHFEAVCDCQACPLGQTRTKFVYGVGNPHADLMFIGEAPGADEDRLGEPFVGRAGQLLDKILAAISLSREDVYIANILKCRPPGNRDPQPDEMASCFPYLQDQIRLIQPKVICLLGRISAQALLKTSTPLGKLRGRWHVIENIPALVTYHPAALLRFQAYKKDTWEDMKKLKARYDELTSISE